MADVTWYECCEHCVSKKCPNDLGHLTGCNAGTCTKGRKKRIVTTIYKGAEDAD